MAIHSELSMTPAAESKHDTYIRVLKSVLPHIQNDSTNIVSAQVLVALKLQGLVGEELRSQDVSMCEVLRDSILESPVKRREALQLAQGLLN